MLAYFYIVIVVCVLYGIYRLTLPDKKRPETPIARLTKELQHVRTEPRAADAACKLDPLEPETISIKDMPMRAEQKNNNDFFAEFMKMSTSTEKKSSMTDTATDEVPPDAAGVEASNRSGIPPVSHRVAMADAARANLPLRDGYN